MAGETMIIDGALVVEDPERHIVLVGGATMCGQTVLPDAYHRLREKWRGGEGSPLPECNDCLKAVGVIRDAGDRAGEGADGRRSAA
jgi:hypothetical protein